MAGEGQCSTYCTDSAWIAVGSDPFEMFITQPHHQRIVALSSIDTLLAFRDFLVKRQASLLIPVMEVRLPAGAGHVALLPPPDRRITPPPDDMSLQSPNTAKTERQTTSSGHPESDVRSRLPPHGPQAPATPVSPMITPLPRHSTDPAQPAPDSRRRPSTAASPIFSPRPYEALYAERAYVTTLLQDLASKLGGLARKYWEVEARLEDPETAKKRRQFRKQASLMRSRIDETTKQHQVMFVRLGELFLEIQSRDALAQVQREDRERQGQPSQDEQANPQPGQSPDTTSSSYASASPPPAFFGIDASATPLSGTSPGSVQRQCPDSRGTILSCQTGCEHSNARGLETVDEAAEEYSCNHGLHYEYCGAEDSTANRPRSERRSSWDGTAGTAADKRLNLPNLQTLWLE